MPGAAYRAGQFFRALWVKPTAVDLEAASQALTPPQFDLFTQLHPSEQAHAIQVYRLVCADPRLDTGISPQAAGSLATAALLHDIGKNRHPLRLWERVLIVLGKAFFKNQVDQWGTMEPNGLARGFVVAAQHAEWGAELAQSAGTDELALSLIRRHQDPPPAAAHSLEDVLLGILQQADEQS